MSEAEAEPATVEEFVQRALPSVNENLDWDVLRDRFDPDPEGNTLGMVLYEVNELGEEEVVEAFGLTVTDGPRIEIVPYSLANAMDQEHVLGLGDIQTFRQTATNVMHPDRDLTPQKACYQRGEVELKAADPLQKRRVWLVGSSIMEMITQELDSLLPGEGA